jgi:hypothetical protein
MVKLYLQSPICLVFMVWCLFIKHLGSFFFLLYSLTSVTQKWGGGGNELCIECAELEARNCTLVPELAGAIVIYIRTIKSRRMAWHVAQMREKRTANRILVGRPEGKRVLGRQKTSGRIILKWIVGWGGMDWINLAPDRNQWSPLVNTVMNFPIS